MASRSIFAVLERVADLVAALSLALVALVTAAAIVLRAFGANLPDAIDFSSMLMGVMVFWAAAVAFRHDDNVRVEFLGSVAPPPVRLAIRVFANLVTAAFMVLMAVAGERQFALVLRSREVTPELRFELWPFAAVAWAGLVLTALMAVALALGWFSSRHRRSAPGDAPGRPGHLVGQGTLHGE
ncbi:TRAP transporter small permease [Microbaculum marinum]|uniref:TRAP transporter small permease protein n=1 Tax=Microbaculum marinum TaxID=1764581 RepID=A0AAW9RKV7_9HYPH